MTDYAVDAALRGEAGLVGHDEERGDELRAIEFDRIRGGKPFDISTPWFSAHWIALASPALNSLLRTDPDQDFLRLRKADNAYASAAPSPSGCGSGDVASAHPYAYRTRGHSRYRIRFACSGSSDPAGGAGASSTSSCSSSSSSAVGTASCSAVAIHAATNKTS